MASSRGERLELAAVALDHAGELLHLRLRLLQIARAGAGCSSRAYWMLCSIRVTSAPAA